MGLPTWSIMYLASQLIASNSSLASNLIPFYRYYIPGFINRNANQVPANTQPVNTGGATVVPTGGATTVPTGGATTVPAGGATTVPTGGATGVPTSGANAVVVNNSGTNPYNPTLGNGLANTTAGTYVPAT